jgi:filamentous hemagglutinin family protein
MKVFIPLSLVSFLSSATLHAEVTLDGTLGSRLTLDGPDYAIGAELGQQHGSNLFHSFGKFNLNRNESATFSGPNSISNVISRVTGGTPSSLDGAIRSTIPEANVYLINPAGLMFGPNATLDVQGSFHASTADTLRFSDGSEFNTSTPSKSLLTVAPVSAFGFLTPNPQPLTCCHKI